MDQKINDNTKFKLIFNNIDESIIIIKQESTEIDYINNKFLTEFQSCILDIIDIDNEYYEDEELSKFEKFKRWLKKIKNSLYT